VVGSLRQQQLQTALAPKQRLDLELVSRNLAASRQQAQQLIRAGRVRSGDRVLDKPGTEVSGELPLEVQLPPRFVSRGGEKLDRALGLFPIAVAGRVCLDGGISTGGFTDCLLQRGAARVYGIDVGYGQTAWSLRCDPRVVLRERTNLRRLRPEELYGPADPRPDLAVADVSFISLALVLPALLELLTPGQNDLVLLVKPQFEVGRGRVGKGGVVRDPAAHEDAIGGVIGAAAGLGLKAAGLVASPITGPAGNHEYLLWLKPGDLAAAPRHEEPVAQAPGPDHGRPEPANTGIASPGLASPGLASPGLASPGLASPGPANTGPANTKHVSMSNGGTSFGGTKTGSATHLCPSDGQPIDPAEIRRLVRETLASS
jgi:23S rRNA (cytidine1920-2'-O)/16S rRNA (cytidine1409-2'-O)-methyltransferase